MLLHAHASFHRIAIFNPDTGDVEQRNRADAGEWLKEPLAGHYGKLAGTMVILYRLDDTLRLRIGADDFPLCCASRVEWRSAGGVSVLEVERDGDTTSLSYPEVSLIAGDPTPFVELEHFDFGLFIANVAADEDRTRRIYRDL